MPCRANQDGGVMVESSDKTWSTGKRAWQTTSVFLPWEPMNSMKRQKDRTLKDEHSRSVGVQYATGDQWRNNSRKNEGMEPEQKQYPIVDRTGNRSKVWCCKEQYCIGTWNVRSMNQGKLEEVKQEKASVNIDILGISKLKWTRMGEFNSDDRYIYYCGQESLGRNGVAILVNKSPKCSTWMQSQKRQNDLCLFSRQTIQYHSYTKAILKTLLICLKYLKLIWLMYNLPSGSALFPYISIHRWFTSVFQNWAARLPKRYYPSITTVNF